VQDFKNNNDKIIVGVSGVLIKLPLLLSGPELGRDKKGL